MPAFMLHSSITSFFSYQGTPRPRVFVSLYWLPGNCVTIFRRQSRGSDGWGKASTSEEPRTRMAKAPVEKPPKDMVHQLAFDRESIRKELRSQKLNTTFNINPRSKFHCITGKPNVRDVEMESKEDQNLAKVLRRNFLEPRMKYTFPQTEAQEIGWITTPLIDTDPNDRRLNFHRRSNEITKFMALSSKTT
ncbi:protein FAM183A isoform X2 [Stegostoma tigrinum]|nr:protein FAM183A isoform X2 [Stegostoma tigrinum]